MNYDLDYLEYLSDIYQEIEEYKKELENENTQI